jgi:hypothetical protein
MYPEMIPTLRKAVEWAEAEHALEAAGIRPSNWFQPLVYVGPEQREESNACGSAYCIAGWVVAQHFDVENPYDATGKFKGVMDCAASILGLEEGESHPLFEGTNTIEDVRRIAEEIAGGPL